MKKIGAGRVVSASTRLGAHFAWSAYRGQTDKGVKTSEFQWRLKLWAWSDWIACDISAMECSCIAGWKKQKENFIHFLKICNLGCSVCVAQRLWLQFMCTIKINSFAYYASLFHVFLRANSSSKHSLKTFVAHPLLRERVPCISSVDGQLFCIHEVQNRFPNNRFD